MLKINKNLENNEIEKKLEEHGFEKLLSYYIKQTNNYTYKIDFIEKTLEIQNRGLTAPMDNTVYDLIKDKIITKTDTADDKLQRLGFEIFKNEKNNIIFRKKENKYLRILNFDKKNILFSGCSYRIDTDTDSEDILPYAMDIKLLKIIKQKLNELKEIQEDSIED